MDVFIIGSPRALGIAVVLEWDQRTSICEDKAVRIRSLRKGNVFNHVCQSSVWVKGGGRFRVSTA